MGGRKRPETGRLRALTTALPELRAQPAPGVVRNASVVGRDLAPRRQGTLSRASSKSGGTVRTFLFTPSSPLSPLPGPHPPLPKNLLMVLFIFLPPPQATKARPYSSESPEPGTTLGT